MKTIAPQLPTVLGSMASMLVVFLCLVNGTAPAICLLKALAAFVVFAGFGLILRYALIDSLEHNQSDAETSANMTARGSRLGMNNLDVIVPGTSVADLLAAQQREAEEERAEDESAAA